MVQTQNHAFTFKSQCLTPLPNGCGVGIVDLRNMSYTSLKDLLPTSPPRTPPSARIGCRDNIPIKDPLVQCAAWAYLHPMEEVRDDGGGLFSLKRLKKTCCGLLGCFSDVVSVVGRRWFCEDPEENDGVEKVG